MNKASTSMRQLSHQALVTLIVWSGLILISRTATATTYYVSTTGNDANSCTQAQNMSAPKRTIAAGLTCVRASDTLYLRAGTYAESIDSNARIIPTGTSWSDAPKIGAYPGESVSLGHMNLAAPSGAGQSSIQYVIFDGLRFINNTTTSDTVAFWGAATHIRIQNSDVSGAKNAHSGINTKPGPGGSGDVQIINTKVHNNGDCSVSCTSGTVGHGLYISTSNNLFDHLESYDNGHLGLQIYYQQTTPAPSNNVVRNSRFHDNQKAYTTSGQGIAVGVGDNNQLLNNLIYRNLGGINADYSGTNTKIYNNTIYANRDFGIRVGNTSGASVQNNIVYQNGTSISNSGTGTTLASNLTTDPKFQNAGAFNFILQAGSAAIDTGVSIGTVPNDFNGVLRPQGSTHDIGAYEYVSSLSPPSAPKNLRILE